MIRNDKSSQELTTHEKYKDFNLVQEVWEELAVDDIVELYLNGVMKRRVQIQHGVNAHVNFTVQDKGSIATEEEKIDLQIAKLQAEKAAIQTK